jgi:hypothetical protein
MYCVSLQVLYLGLRLWTSVGYVLCFSSGFSPWAHSRSPRYNTCRETQCISYRSPQSYPKVKYLKRNIIHTWPKSTIVAQDKIPEEKHNTYLTEVHSRSLKICIVFLFRYCILGYDCGLRWGMYYVSLQVFHLGLRLWTSVRYVFCFSTGNVPWTTTVAVEKQNTYLTEVHSRSPRYNNRNTIHILP